MKSLPVLLTVSILHKSAVDWGFVQISIYDTYELAVDQNPVSILHKSAVDWGFVQISIYDTYELAVDQNLALDQSNPQHIHITTNPDVLPEKYSNVFILFLFFTFRGFIFVNESKSHQSVFLSCPRRSH